MERTIAFIEVRRGDVVSKRKGVLIRVDRVGRRGGEVFLSGVYCQYGDVYADIVGGADELLGFHHRPWDEGKTEEDMLDAIFAEASLPGRMWPMSAGSRKQLHEKLVRLRKAIDVYELGLPLEMVRPDPTDTESEAATGFNADGWH